MSYSHNMNYCYSHKCHLSKDSSWDTAKKQTKKNPSSHFKHRLEISGYIYKNNNACKMKNNICLPVKKKQKNCTNILTM